MLRNETEVFAVIRWDGKGGRTPEFGRAMAQIQKGPMLDAPLLCLRFRQRSHWYFPLAERPSSPTAARQ
jgi:hypothetical protein